MRWAMDEDMEERLADATGDEKTGRTFDLLCKRRSRDENRRPSADETIGHKLSGSSVT